MGANEESLEQRSALEHDVDDAVARGAFAVALSGGGHRATLVTLGGLLAVVDRDLARQTLQISSVSGGSITNAFVAQGEDFRQLKRGQMDDAAADLCQKVTGSGVLNWRWWSLIGGGLTAIFAVVLWAVTAVLPTRLWAHLVAFSAGLCAALTGWMTSGLVVESRINHQYFRRTTDDGPRSRGRATIGSLDDPPVDHVFCTTDLVTGLPCYFSSKHRGMYYRRMATARPGDPVHDIASDHAAHFTLAEVVRASAAFPGIPPRRLRFRIDPKYPDTSLVAYLMDGGIWNNLGTQVIREDHFLGHLATREDGILRPTTTAPPGTPVLVIDGSAPLAPSPSWPFAVPVVATVAGLLRMTKILNHNTVAPRKQAMQEATPRRSWAGVRPDHNDPASLVVDMSDNEYTSNAYREGTWTEDLIRGTDPDVKKWEQGRIRAVRLAHEWAANDDWDPADHVEYLMGDKPPQGGYPVAGLASIEDWDRLRTDPAWIDLVDTEASGDVGAATTLNPIKPADARRLIARGYLNTFLASLFLKPLADEDLEALAAMPRRLDKIVGSAASGD